MKKVWEAIKKFFEALFKGIKTAICYFFKIFDTKTKIAAIALTVYIWFSCHLELADKIGMFILFGVLMLLIGYIVKESK